MKPGNMFATKGRRLLFISGAVHQEMSKHIYLLKNVKY